MNWFKLQTCLPSFSPTLYLLPFLIHPTSIVIRFMLMENVNIAIVTCCYSHINRFHSWSTVRCGVALVDSFIRFYISHTVVSLKLYRSLLTCDVVIHLFDKCRDHAAPFGIRNNDRHFKLDYGNSILHMCTVKLIVCLPNHVSSFDSKRENNRDQQTLITGLPTLNTSSTHCQQLSVLIRLWFVLSMEQ